MASFIFRRTVTLLIFKVSDIFESGTGSPVSKPYFKRTILLVSSGSALSIALLNESDSSFAKALASGELFIPLISETKSAGIVSK